MSIHLTTCAAIVFLAAGSSVIAGERMAIVSPKEPAVLKGNLAKGKDESWRVIIKGGKEARLQILKGRHAVVADIYDPQDITANEGVAEEDWFPVVSGQYKITVTNTTNLGTKSGGRDLSYEATFEVK